MKVTVEVDDSVIRKAIEEQVQKVVANLTSDLILAKVDTILSVKTSRLTDKAVDVMFAESVDRVVAKAVGTHYGAARSAVDHALKEAARELVKKNL